jgi:hypothetical protein
MKSAILIIILALTNSLIKCQCIADAGPDKVVCVTRNGVEPIEIGGNPSASNGTSPFTYTWTAFYQITIGQSTFTYTASDFLNDTTIANPEVIYSVENPVEFILTVKDLDNNICRDTVRVRFSRFGMHLGNMIYNITQGDSVNLSYEFSNVMGGIEPIEILWKPNNGLTDSTSHSVWAKPQQNTVYYITVTDSAGCEVEGDPLYYVNVSPLSVINISEHNPLTIFPNPTENSLHIKSNLPPKKLILSLTNSNGVVVRQEIATSEKLNLEFISPGIYFYKITDGEEVLGQGKLIKK